MVLCYNNPMKQRFQECYAPFFLFILSFLIYSFIVSPNGFPDPDALYHIKTSQLLVERGIFTEFPWNQLSIIKDAYVDHHFLYHLFLIPFITLFGGILGAKISIAFLGAFFSVFLYFFLRSFRVRFPWFWVILLLGTYPFLFRASLLKANVFSLFFLLLSLQTLFRKKNIFLFFISFFYVWAYGGWPFLFILGSFALIISREYLRGVFSMFFGVVGGLVLNPYFPENLYFFKTLWFGVALSGYQPTIFVGAEWLSYAWHILLLQSIFFIAIFVFSGALFLHSFKAQPKESRVFMLLAFFWYVLTLRSRRNVEYLVPFSIVASAFAVHFSPFEEMISSYIKKVSWKRIVLGYGGIFIISFLVFSTAGISALRRNFKTLGKWSFRYQHAVEWLQKNTTPGTVVFHPTWDEFPFLFYWNDSNYFIGGLDPRLSWLHNPDKYILWEKIGDGNFSEDLSDIIQKEFGTRFVVVDWRHKKFETQIKKDSDFIERFSDKDARVYEIQ